MSAWVWVRTMAPYLGITETPSRSGQRLTPLGHYPCHPKSLTESALSLLLVYGILNSSSDTWEPALVEIRLRVHMPSFLSFNKKVSLRECMKGQMCVSLTPCTPTRKALPSVYSVTLIATPVCWLQTVTKFHTHKELQLRGKKT